MCLCENPVSVRESALEGTEVTHGRSEFSHTAPLLAWTGELGPTLRGPSGQWDLKRPRVRGPRLCPTSSCGHLGQQHGSPNNSPSHPECFLCDLREFSLKTQGTRKAAIILIYNDGEISRDLAWSQLLPYPCAASSLPGLRPLLCLFLCVLFYKLKGEKHDLSI